MADGTIRTEIVPGGVAIITIDRPEKRNALTEVMVDQLREAFGVLNSNETVNCLVLTGAGNKAFCAGHDLKTLGPGNLGQLYEEEHMQVFLAPRQVEKPVICAVNGAAYAGGLCLALNCDLRLATPEATFGIPAARLGMVPIAGQSARLPHLLPLGIVTEMVISGKPLTSGRAEQFGFVNAVVPVESLLDRAVSMAREIAAMSPTSVRSYKRIANASVYESVAKADAMEYWLGMAAGHGWDLPEGLAAFAERRPPDFAARGGNKAE